MLHDNENSNKKYNAASNDNMCFAIKVVKYDG